MNIGVVFPQVEIGPDPVPIGKYVRIPHGLYSLGILAYRNRVGPDLHLREDNADVHWSLLCWCDSLSASLRYWSSHASLKHVKDTHPSVRWASSCSAGSKRPGLRRQRDVSTGARPGARPSASHRGSR